MEAELVALGIETAHSWPYHPQTCGKVEGVHQTLKKYSDKQEPAAAKKLLERQLDRFVEYHNTA
jgi:putative transposase